MKKVIIGIIALFAVAAVFLFFFPGLPKYIYIRLADKYPSLNAKLEEFDLSGVTVSDDLVEIKDEHGLSVKIAPDMKPKEDARFPTYINSDKSAVLIIKYDESPHANADEQFKFATHEQIEKFFKTRNTPVPTSQYEFLKFTYSMTYNDFNTRSLIDEKIFRKLAESKEELFNATEESYSFHSGDNCGFVECIGEKMNQKRYVASLYTGSNYENSFMIIISSDNIELIKQIIASIKIEK